MVPFTVHIYKDFNDILQFSEMGTDRTPDPTAGPLPGHFSLRPGVKGQDGTLQYKRSQTGENERLHMSRLKQRRFGGRFQEGEAARADLIREGPLHAAATKVVDLV